MSDKNIPGVDDHTGREVIKSRDIRPPEKWKPTPGGATYPTPQTKDWKPPSERGVGMYQSGNPLRQRIPANPNGSKPDMVTLPESWPGVTLTDLGAVFDPSAVTVETWQAFGRWAGATNRRTRLWLGDWIWYNDDAEFGFTLDDMHEITGLELETLRSYASIGFNVTIANRILGPKPSYYATVAPLPQPEQKEWLKRVKKEELTRDELRRLVAPRKKEIREAKLLADGKRPAGRPTKAVAVPAPSLVEDMEKAANMVVTPEPDRFATPMSFEGSVRGAKAFLAELPDNARVSIIVLAD